MYQNPNWYYAATNTNKTYTLQTTNTAGPPLHGRLIVDDIPIAPAPATEIERLLADVESVCALAR